MAVCWRFGVNMAWATLMDWLIRYGKQAGEDANGNGCLECEHPSPSDSVKSWQVTSFRPAVDNSLKIREWSAFD